KDGERHRTTVQAVPPRGAEAVPQGRALPDGEVWRRAALVRTGRARPRPPQTERVPRPAAREAEGAALLRGARAPVPRLLREGFAAAGDHGREPARAARVPPGQRARAAGLRGLTPPGASADPPRSLDGERPSRRHPELP